MTPALRPGLFFRQFENIILFFDLPLDRYFMLSGSRAQRFERFVAGRGRKDDIEALQSEGLISSADRRSCPKNHQVLPPTRSLVDNPLPQGSVRATIASLTAQISARRDLRRHELAHVIGGLHSDFAGAGSPDSIDCTDLAGAFLRAARYLPAADQCLARSIAMKRLLLARGRASILVFGVTMPFAAHCWVQVGDTVLTDPLDIVLRYQPIFAI
ncbi:lasso peptide biosynthesis B2 protein [Sphingopyxis indica]|uniref:Transglutaminase-like superfamily protein n=1 Tax=Sphingopyxis indica TaxID=436663 RepID=A0A239JX31_9SPHN|nr:lasso peptide biosynthesis B2 protein [Sphingopyxis indica]SNT10451.1 Transglutaminase-like superfamily protein [Sphingopyxis indica]